jgi:hypothetical protein
MGGGGVLGAGRAQHIEFKLYSKTYSYSNKVPWSTMGQKIK